MISNKYDLLEKLTTSPVGNIYRGCNLDQQSEVAILELSPHFREERDTFNDIWNAILPVCNLKHDFLVPVIDLDKSKGWIIMELRGTSLTKILQKTPLPHNVARTILRDILSVLDYFQSHKVQREEAFIHGDIRPDTLLLPNRLSPQMLEQQRVKLGFSPGATVCGEVPLGQRDGKYLAPEMINSELGQLTPAADLYMLAFAILEALVGPSFDSRFAQVGQDRDTLWFNWHGSVSREIPSPRVMVPNLPEDLATVLERMLKKKVEDRPASAQEVLDMLSATESEPIPAALLAMGTPVDGDGSSDAIQKTSDWGAHGQNGQKDLVDEPSARPAVSARPSSKPTAKKRDKAVPIRHEGDGPKRWSRAWFDIQFKKPYILWPFAVFILTLGGLIGLMLQPEDKVDVVIKTEPANAEIKIRSKPLKPLEDKDKKNAYSIPVGTHNFVFTAKGYEDLKWKLKVTEKGELLDEKETKVGTIKLERAMVETVIITNPDDAKISVDSKILEPLEDTKNTYRIPVGENLLTFTRDGYDTRDMKLTVTDKGELQDKGKKAGTIVLEKTKEVVPPASVAEESKPDTGSEVITPKPLFPITLRVIPDDAEILFGDQKGIGELLIQYDPTQPLEMEFQHPDCETENVKVNLDDLEKAREMFVIEETSDGGILTYMMKTPKPPVGPELPDDSSAEELFGNLPKTLSPVDGSEIDEQYHLPILVEVVALKETAPMLMTLITPGAFSYGVPPTEPLYSGELRAVDVTIDTPYYIALDEVTRQQYAQFLEDGDSLTISIPASQANLPMGNVSHTEALAFCQWLGGWLPTEMEWEYAATYPGLKSPYPWGKADPTADRANLFDTNDGEPVPVDQLPRGKSPRGLSHLVGNVSEWCDDPYQAGANESQDNVLLRDTFVIRSPSFSMPSGPEARLTWRAPAKDQKTEDIGFRPIVRVNIKDKGGMYFAPP